jgi:hypothetical protein
MKISRISNAKIVERTETGIVDYRKIEKKQKKG